MNVPISSFPDTKITDPQGNTLMGYVAITTGTQIWHTTTAEYETRITCCGVEVVNQEFWFRFRLDQVPRGSGPVTGFPSVNGGLFLESSAGALKGQGQTEFVEQVIRIKAKSQDQYELGRQYALELHSL